MSLPKVPSIELITERLLLIFPEGTENRHFVINEMAARTVYVMFYSAAIDGKERWILPGQVTDMTDEQAAKTSDKDRKAWIKASLSNRFERTLDSWYKPKARGPLREETIRNGFMALGAVLERQGLPVITPLPKYAMDNIFASLFDEKLVDEELEICILAWQEANLNTNALSRIRLVGTNSAASKKTGVIKAALPNAGAVMLDAGPAGTICKSVFEKFAPRFMKTPAVLWFSPSKEKVGADLAKKLNIKLDPSASLPDVILADLGEKEDGSDVFFTFVEIVTSEGAISSLRKKYLMSIAEEAGFGNDRVAYVSAFQDRSTTAFVNTVSKLAWGTHAWFCSEPNNIMNFTAGSSVGFLNGFEPEFI